MTVPGKAIALLGAFLILSLAAPSFAQTQKTYMGFTPWPYDLTGNAVEKTYDFIAKNSNIIAHHLDNGVPWEEALNRTQYPEHLRNEWRNRISNTPESHKTYLAITPINFQRNAISPYWSDKGDNQPLPKAWRNAEFNDPRVKQAFLNYARSAVHAFKPDFLAIGIESNLIITNAPAKWQSYLELNKFVYIHLKKEFPDLPIFSTVQYEHIRGIERESKKHHHMQVPAIRELMKHSDMLALSTYRYGTLHPNPPGEDYFNPAFQFGKKIAIAEMGSMSQTTKVMGIRLPASENTQYEFLDMVLKNAQKHKFVFVINWVAIDFDRMIKKLPRKIRPIAMAWVHTGLLNKNLKPKKAYGLWVQTLNGK